MQINIWNKRAQVTRLYVFKHGFKKINEGFVLPRLGKWRINMMCAPSVLS